MERPDWAPEAIDIDRPSAARIYDYALGGLHNFAVDRQAAREMFALMPDLPLLMQANRAFLRRTVQFLVHAGIRQFLDIGSGIPTTGNVHETAQRIAPETRVMYVDIDPVAVAHSRAILANTRHTGVILEDLRQPEHILANPEVRSLLDFDQPMAVLLVAVMQFVPEEDDPVGIVARIHDAVAPGSYVVMSQPTNDSRAEEAGRVEELINKLPSPFGYASRPTFASRFAGWDVIEPGIVWVPEWHPDSPSDVDEHPERSLVYVGVGRKP